MTSSPFEVGAVIEGRYRVEAELGAGGFGVVYRARQLSTEQSVAVKVMQPELLEGARAGKARARFEREMKLITGLRHPNIVRVLDFGQFKGCLYTVLEFVDGHALADVLLREGALASGEALRLMRQVLEALALAHGRGVVHRDIKPDNIMVTDAGGGRRNAMVLDFGIASVLEGSGWEIARVTQAREFQGTPAYMAPEQIEGALVPQSDLYAWGLVFLECLTGAPAIHADTPLAALVRHGSDEPIALPEALLDTPLGAVLERALAKPLEARAPDAAALLDALDDLDALPVLPPNERALSPARTPEAFAPTLATPRGERDMLGLRGETLDAHDSSAALLDAVSDAPSLSATSETLDADTSEPSPAPEVEVVTPREPSEEAEAPLAAEATQTSAGVSRAGLMLFAGAASVSVILALVLGFVLGRGDGSPPTSAPPEGDTVEAPALATPQQEPDVREVEAASSASAADASSGPRPDTERAAAQPDVQATPERLLEAETPSPALMAHLGDACEGGEGEACALAEALPVEGYAFQMTPEMAAQMTRCDAGEPEGCAAFDRMARELDAENVARLVRCEEGEVGACEAFAAQLLPPESGLRGPEGVDAELTPEELAACRREPEGCLELRPLIGDVAATRLWQEESLRAVLGVRCEEGMVEACVGLAIRDIAESWDRVEASLETLESACSADVWEATACTHLGFILSMGALKDREPERGERLIRRSCELSHDSRACSMLAVMNVSPEIRAMARERVELACYQHVPGACGGLGDILLEGSAVEAQPERARELVEPECRAFRDADACDVLAVILGDSTHPEDRVEAQEMLEHACELGSSWACYRLGLQKVIAFKNREATALLLPACEGRSSPACEELYKLYQHSSITEMGVSYEEIFEALGSACRQSDRQTCAATCLFMGVQHDVHVQVCRRLGHMR